MGIAKMVWSMNKKKTAAPKLVDTVKPSEVCAVLDHPQQGEKITAPRYTFRIGTLGAIARVELSLNEGPWQPCRHSVGYWWYDWSGYKAGRYQAVAKAWTKDGQVFVSELRNFQVLGEKPKAIKTA
jgi:hypothetical protein